MVIKVRKAIKSDMPFVMAMIQELADFTKVPSEPKITIEDLYRDGGFNNDNDILKQSPFFYSFIAEDHSTANEEPVIVGHALGSFIYKTAGKCFHLNDLYVKQSHRKQGVGENLVGIVAEFAKETNCDRIDFHVLEWNPARHFYAKFNAVNSTEADGYQYYRLFKNDMQ